MACNRQFANRSCVSDDELWHLYVHKKQTYNDLASQFNLSARTVQRRINRAIVTFVPPAPRSVVVIMDTTYFGRSFGVVVLRDAITSDYLWRKYVSTEKLADYAEGLNYLKGSGFNILAAACDGRKGLLGRLAPIPVQMCQFHQIAIVTRYLTHNPKDEASIALKSLVSKLPKFNRSEFEHLLDHWHGQWKDVVNERVGGKKGTRSSYKNKNLRSSYRSLRTNMPWLFTYREHPDLAIPNTTNSLEGSFSALKNKLRNHNGLSIQNRHKFIDEFLRHKT